MSNATHIDILSSDRTNFPWTKFYTLMKRPEVYENQLEDNSMPISEIDLSLFERDPRVMVWLVMRDEKSLGFVMVAHKGVLWRDIHTGWREGVAGSIKKTIGRGILHLTFLSGARKITATVPAWNRGACVMAVACGMRREGVIKKSFLKNGQLWDQILFGVEAP